MGYHKITSLASVIQLQSNNAVTDIK